MGDDLKKVGLIFKADGSVDFVKSLKLVNATLKENYEDFKLVQAQWDKNTTSSQKLADKLVYLNGAYDIQSDKVTTLKKDLEALEKAENKDEVAIQKKKAALTGAEVQLQRYQNQLKETSNKIQLGTADLEDFGKKLDKIGDGLVSAGKKMLVFSAGYVAALGTSVKSAIDFESAFAGVEKTVNATEEQLSNLKKGIRDMSKEIPASTTEISAVAEAAGQLGIKTEDILSFTKVMVDLGESTNLSSNDAATALARFANITQMSQKDFDKLGSTVVDLGNNFATTEAEIVDMALRLAGAGKVVGMSESDILSFSAALSSVGIEAEAGGSAFSKVMVDIESMVATNSQELEKWARVAGMSTSDFKKAWEEDAASALITFIKGLGELDKNGGNSITTLEDLGITEIRMRDALLRASGAGDLFSNALKTGSEAWKENIALTTEAGKRYETTESQLKIAKNTLNDIGITIGEKILPNLNEFLDKFKGVLEWFGTLTPEIQNTILIIAGIVAAIGPLLIIIGKIATGISALISLFEMLAPVFSAIGAVVAGIASALGLPVIVVVAIIAAIITLVILIVKYWNQIKEFTINLFNSIKESLTIFFTSTIEFIKSTINNVILILRMPFDFIANILIITVTNIYNFFLMIVQVIQSAINIIITILSVPFDFLKNVFILMVALLAITLESIWNFIKPFIDLVIELFKFLYDAIKTGIEFVLNIYKTIFEFIKSNIVLPFVNSTISLFQMIWNSIIVGLEFIKNIFNTVINFIKSNIINPLVNFFGGIFNSILNIINSVIDRIKGAFASVKDFVINIFDSIKNSIILIFSSISGIIKTPINGIISLINNVLSSLNKIKVPDWVPNLGGASVNFKMLPFLAKGGELMSGSAIVAEAGPELLLQQGNSTKVMPLSNGGGAKKTEIIDYKKLAKILASTMAGLKFSVDEDGFGKFIDNKLLEVL